MNTASNWRRLPLALFAIAITCSVASAAAPTTHLATAPQFLLDSGEGGTYSDPRRLAELGYTGQITGSIEGIQLFDDIAPGIIPEASPPRQWAMNRIAALQQRIREVHAAGLKCYASTDLIVLPKALVASLKDEICDANGRFDTRLPKMREVLHAMFRETFQRLPELDGVVIRTGEVYLQDYPFHAASAATKQNAIQANTAILHGTETHVDLIQILREEVCVKANRIVFYRTWDFGPNGFHESTGYYLKVTDAIEPHPNLIFSIKHQKGDFHQLSVFNPTLTIGKHRQIVEVQSQREAYGKGAHPYYVGQGVIDGWEEYEWMMKPDQAKGLRDIIHNPLLAGVWTWSRGGGWDGPIIPDDFWCRLNTWVVSQYARDPSRGEPAVFADYAARIGLSGQDVDRFRELCLLSEKAVLRGQLTTLGAKIDLWWARDDVLEAPDLSDFIRKGLVEKALAEKAEAVRMWKRIEELSRQIRFADPQTQNFVEVSCTYGRIKYSIIEQGWTILMLGKVGDSSGTYDRARMSAAITEYDRLWREWRDLKQRAPACATLPKETGRNGRAGMGAAVERYRALVTRDQQSGNGQAQP